MGVLESTVRRTCKYWYLELKDTIATHHDEEQQIKGRKMTALWSIIHLHHIGIYPHPKSTPNAPSNVDVLEKTLHFGLTKDKH